MRKSATSPAIPKGQERSRKRLKAKMKGAKRAVMPAEAGIQKDNITPKAYKIDLQPSA